MADNGEMLAQLEKSYCPPLDNATFLAILSDYDIDDPEQLKAARASLDTLTESVGAEEATGFDPSGSSGRDGNNNPPKGAESESGHSQPGWSSYTDDTSLSQGISALDLEGLEASDAHNSIDGGGEKRDSSAVTSYNAQLEGLDRAGKEAVLIETFPGLKPFDIKWTLDKCKGNCGFAIDELLHQVFLADGGHRYKGIEAFSESDIPSRPRKGKGKKRRPRGPEVSSVTDREDTTSGFPTSKWDSARQDIDFISSRIGMPVQQVTSLYHKSGASACATINVIIEAHMALQMKSEDATVDIHAQELSQEFPTIPTSHLLALTQLTHPSTSSAHELAKALVNRPATRAGTHIEIEFRLPPPDLSDGLAQPKPKSHNAVFNLDELPIPLKLTNGTTESSRDLLVLRNEAFTHASAAYRRGKSDHLISGAAAYYSSLGRSYDAAAKSALSSAADSLAASQSTSSMLDLHGINVKEAVRIARENVTAWWVRVKEKDSHGGYRIVTGKGTHSVDGRGKLGPAVGAMLIREGWRVEVGSGVLVITGVVARR